MLFTTYNMVQAEREDIEFHPARILSTASMKNVVELEMNVKYRRVTLRPSFLIIMPNARSHNHSKRDYFSNYNIPEYNRNISIKSNRICF